MSGVTKTQYGAEKTLRLNNDQIIALGDSSVIVVPAISGRIVLPLFVILSLNPSLADYTTNVAAAWGIDNSTDGSGAYFSSSSDDPASVLGAGQSEMQAFDYASSFFDGGPLTLADLTGDLSLVLDNDGDGPLTGGDPANILTVMVSYLTLPFVT